MIDPDIVLHTAPDFDYNNMTYIPFCIRFMNDMHIYAGRGIPDHSLGIDGDYYFRSDTPGKGKQRIYVKSGNIWTGII